MPDPRATVRLVDELLWSLRRAGFTISTAQAIDVARALGAVGLDQRSRVRETVAAIVVDRASERARFDRSFDAFFASRHGYGTLWERLAAQGFAQDELDAFRELLAGLAQSHADGLVPLGLLLERGAGLDRALALAGLARTVDAQSGAQIGFLGHRLLSQIGAGRARNTLQQLRARLVAALGVRGDLLSDALAKELEGSEEDVRSHVRGIYENRLEDLRDPSAFPRAQTTPFSALSDAEIEEVRRAVRRLADRLRGGARVRRRRATRGRIDAHATIRRALRTGGVPLHLARRTRRRDRPKLVLLCDVSDSVRAAAAFLLEFVYAVQELFSRARSFVFVSELGETTDLFARQPVRVAIAQAWGGGVVRSGDNSNYGRALQAFEREIMPTLDRRTTVVVLGDGRTNFHDAAPEVLGRIRERCRALLWLCPEPRGQWSQGDSAMPLYASRCTAVYEARCAADLESVARVLVARG
jgi:uncharacterized protein with von Willebrand factor type A (vWA) domain